MILHFVERPQVEKLLTLSLWIPTKQVLPSIDPSFNLVGIPYAGVIPIEKAIDPFGDAILAYEMNGWYFA